MSTRGSKRRASALKGDNVDLKRKSSRDVHFFTGSSDPDKYTQTPTKMPMKMAMMMQQTQARPAREACFRGMLLVRFKALTEWEKCWWAKMLEKITGH